MRRSSSLALPFILSTLLAGCSDPPGTPADGGAPTDGATTTDAPVGDAGCVAPTVVLADVNAASLRLAGTDLVFVDRGAGPPFTNSGNSRAVRKIGLAGTGDTVLYAAPSGKQISDVEVDGTTVYFLEAERLSNGLDATRIFSVPLAGGTPTLVVLHDDPDMGVNGQGDRLDGIVGVDATNLYVVRGLQTSATIWRVAKAGGAETRLTKSSTAIDATSVSSRPSLVNGELYFLTGQFPAPVNYDAIGKLAATASNAAPTQVGTALCRGDMTAYGAGIFCTGAAEVGPTNAEQHLSRFDLTGGAHADLFSLTNSSGISLLIGPTDGTSIYVVQERSSSSGGNLYKVPVAGGPASVVACDRHKIVGRGTFESGGSNGAYYGPIEMVATPTELAWIETRKEGSTDKTSIFRVAR